ncbi:hypothetical protein A2856_04260 [Candidatus Uhrbacteria bacterium RIFCSPHIGHO2_01_FULL_63_20]|uniref:General secretion pathway GspH domain-containing protein n=1 Tax=Candidatus Uhrbacteria bacterium RIFCSPHIGHO2_01_FULL_63_20 TaxID=1802385 RepID=A0A1F7TNP8_9BACT|nr:MAG: hypothetical protein A2856_04260 [Candidatus Uhrbacteria bacterium RIFCSPHIGHO2_01_FULL_63_20]
MDRRGFTLIEVLIYSVLLAVGVLTLATVYRASVETRSFIAAESALIANRRTAETLIRDRLSEATGVVTPASGSSATLVLTSPVPAESPVTFALSDGALTMQLGAGDVAPITGSDVTVTSFTATRRDGIPASVLVEIGWSEGAFGATITDESRLTATLRL